MPTDVSSSEPEKLGRYSVQMCLRDQDTAAACGPLRSALHHFEATCRESPFAFRVSHLPDPVQSHANQCVQSDDWVGWVGECFWAADGGALDMFVTAGFTPGLPALGTVVIVGTSSARMGYRMATTLPSELRNAPWREFPDYLVPDFGWPDNIGHLGTAIGIVDDARRLRGIGRITGKFTKQGMISMRGGSALKQRFGWTAPQLPLRYLGGLESAKQVGGSLHKLAWKAAKPKPSYLGVVAAGFTVWEQFERNRVDDSNDGPVKVVVGTAVDSALVIGAGLAGKTVGSYAGGMALGAAFGAASGGLLAPFGVAIGSTVGGIAGEYVGAAAGQFLIDNTSIDEIATDGVTEIVDNVTESAQQIGNALANRVDQVASAFGWFANSVAALV